MSHISQMQRRTAVIRRGGRKVLWLSRCPMLHLERRSEIPVSLTSLSVLRRPASSVKQHQSPSRPVRPASIPEFTSESQLCVQNITCDSVSDGPLLDLIDITRFVFDDFAGERPSCEDPQPLDGYEGWSSSGLAAHDSDDLAASGCLERNPKLGTHIHQVVEAYRNITKRYQHIKPSQNTSAHTYQTFLHLSRHIKVCQKYKIRSKHIKRYPHISNHIKIYQTFKPYQTYQNISNHIN